MRAVAPFCRPKRLRSLWESAATVVPFLSFWLLTWATLRAGYWIGVVLAAPTGVFLLRLFLIQHDRGHGSFLHSRAANDRLGRVLGVLTFTPYEYWRRSHAVHYASTGNLSARGVGDVDTLTLTEFLALGRARQLLYRLYRHPVVLFGFGPAYLFLLQHRLPVGMMRKGWKPWASAMGTNASIAVVVSVLVWAIGWKLALAVHLPVMLTAATLGVWFFYVQHQFEKTSWDSDEDWSFHIAALNGSSHYHLPSPLRWLSANVGIHHVHHLAGRVPFYRLPEVLTAVPVLASTSRVTLRESFQAVRLVLWDEQSRRLVPFAAAR